MAVFSIPKMECPAWRCPNWQRQKRESNLDPEGPLKELFDQGSANAARALLAVARAATQRASGHKSSGELAAQVGITGERSSAHCQRSAGHVRSRCPGRAR